jgi:hypothetical protein
VLSVYLTAKDKSGECRPVKIGSKTYPPFYQSERKNWRDSRGWRSHGDTISELRALKLLNRLSNLPTVASTKKGAIKFRFNYEVNIL